MYNVQALNNELKYYFYKKYAETQDYKLETNDVQNLYLICYSNLIHTQFSPHVLIIIDSIIKCLLASLMNSDIIYTFSTS